MAQKFLTNLDLNQNQLIKTRFQFLASDPEEGLFEGWVYYNTTSDSLRIYQQGYWHPFLNEITFGGSSSAAFSQSEAGGVVTITANLATSSANGLMPSADKAKLDDATSDATSGKLVIRDVSGNIKVATPTDAAHAATKGYVDAARQGLDVKRSVRVATTAALTLSGALVNGNSIDGVTLVTGDRVLVKDQETPSQNGIYVVLAEEGTAVRATDADGTADTGTVSGGTFTFVEEGTLYADSGWVVSSNGAITVGTNAMEWVQFSGAGTITAGDGLTKDGSTLHVNDDNTTIYIDGSDNLGVKSSSVQYQTLLSNGSSTTAAWGRLPLSSSAAVEGQLPIANGGTSASTESGARTALAAGGIQGGTVQGPSLTRKVVMGLGNGVDTSFVIQHGFDTRDVMVQVYDTATYDTVITDTVRTDADNVTISFSTAPGSNDYTAVVIG
jgi:hypothetical protein